MSTPSSNTAENLDSGQIIAESPSYWSSVRSNLRNDPVTVTFSLILLMLLLSAIFADFIAPLDPYKTSMIKRLKPVGTEGFLFGTDELGRDMLTRLIYGGRLSLLMGITPVVAALFFGGLLGLTAGFIGGKVNMSIMRVMDVFYAFPSVLLAIAISGALGAGIFNAIISLTIVFIPPIARVTESVTTARVFVTELFEGACQVRNYLTTTRMIQNGRMNWRRNGSRKKRKSLLWITSKSFEAQSDSIEVFIDGSSSGNTIRIGAVRVMLWVYVLEIRERWDRKHFRVSARINILGVSTVTDLSCTREMSSAQSRSLRRNIS